MTQYKEPATWFVVYHFSLRLCQLLKVCQYRKQTNINYSQINLIFKKSNINDLNARDFYEFKCYSLKYFFLKYCISRNFSKRKYLHFVPNIGYETITITRHNFSDF